jgi:hypothetical protein
VVMRSSRGVYVVLAVVVVAADLGRATRCPVSELV